MDFKDLLAFSVAMEESKLRKDINKKASEIVNAVDVKAMANDENFKQMLSYCFAMKAAGLTPPSPIK